MFSFKNPLNIKGDCFIFFKRSFNSTPNHIEDNEFEKLIIVSISTLKRLLATDITRETFDELLQNMVESNAFKLRTVRDRECLSLPKEEAKDAISINNRTKSDLEVFKFKSSLYKLL